MPRPTSIPPLGAAADGVSVWARSPAERLLDSIALLSRTDSVRASCDKFASFFSCSALSIFICCSMTPGNDLPPAIPAAARDVSVDKRLVAAAPLSPSDFGTAVVDSIVITAESGRYRDGS